jgi:hypothetical protein
MKQKEQRQLDSMQRARDFVNEHAGELPFLAASDSKQQLDEAIAQVEMLGTAQGTADLEMDGLLARRRAIAADLRARHMLSITLLARARLRVAPELAALTVPTDKLSASQLVAAARAMATAAAPQLDALIRDGFPGDVIVQLEATADAMQEAMEERANRQVERMAATRGIQEQIRRGREAVRMLDAVVCQLLRDEPMGRASWHSAQRVGERSGAPRRAAAARAAAPTATSVRRTVRASVPAGLRSAS